MKPLRPLSFHEVAFLSCIRSVGFISRKQLLDMGMDKTLIMKLVNHGYLEASPTSNHFTVSENAFK